MADYILFIFSLLLTLFGSILLIKNTVGKFRISIISIFVIILLCYLLFFIISDYFTGEGINDAVIYHLKYGLIGAGFSEYTLLISGSLAALVLSFVFSYKAALHLSKRTKQEERIQIKSRGILPYTPVIAGIILSPTTHGLLHYTSLTTPDEQTELLQFSDYYVKNNIEQVSNKPRNLVYIYAEGLERGYFDETIFPGLIQELRNLESISTTFTQIEQVRKTGWTIGGITASQCGIPLVTPSHGNSMDGIDAFLPNAECLGDVLSAAGYKLSIFNGSSLEFSGLGKFFNSHGFDNAYDGPLDLVELIHDRSYVNGWGLYDDSLFDIALNEFYNLSIKEESFGLFVSTMDTHQPRGHISSSCDGMKYGDGNNQMLNAVKCSDYLISKFVREILSSKQADNTIIVISSDHLAHRNTATALLEKVPQRRNLFMVIDPSNKGVRICSRGSMLDVASTIIPIMGFKGNIGLGRNLLDDQSLISEIPDFDTVLASWDKSIMKFWSFPEVRPTDSLYIEPNNKVIAVKGRKFKYPLLIEFDDSYKSQIRFQFNSLKGHKLLFNHLINFEAGTRFLWIDSCAVMSKFKKGKLSEYCLMYGKASTQDIHFSPIIDDEVILGANIHFPKYRLKVRNKQEIVNDSREVDRFIAHAGGKIDGHTYTNSLEALNNSYDDGFRLFELDIIRTSDNVYVASHDWNHWIKSTGFTGNIPPTRDVFKSYRIKKKYTPMDIDDINRWFSSHPDAILVTDKINEPLRFSELFVDKTRLMMELFSLDAVAEGVRAGIRSAMPTWGLLKGIKGDIVNTLTDLGVSHIAASRRVVENNLSLIRKLKNNGIEIYVFHVNLDKGKDEQFVVCNEMNYVYGLYADTYNFNHPVDCFNNY